MHREGDQGTDPERTQRSDGSDRVDPEAGASSAALGARRAADDSRHDAQDRADFEQIAALQRQAAVDRQVLSVLAEQGLADRAEIAQLQRALVTARRIGAAMGIIMATTRVDEAAAFEALRTVSQHTNRKLRDVADDVVYTGALDVNP